MESVALNMAQKNSDLARLLAPASVAVIGASEDQTKFGGRVFKFLLQHGYNGTIYPITKSKETLFGIKAYPSISKTPTPPDLVVMAVPRDSVKAAIGECAAVGTQLAIVITANFSDAGEEGAVLEGQIVEVARSGKMRLIGPNCLGLISPANNLVLCASPTLAVDCLPRGRIGLVSESGALMAAAFDKAMTRGIGFSHCFSIGNQADLDLCDFVDFLISDPNTDVICSYIESVKRPERLLEVSRRARLAGIPWLALKAGRTEFGAAAAFSHTASLAGSYQAFEAACKAGGIVTMEDVDAMILLATGLSRHPNAMLERVGIVATSGGSGIIAVDSIVDAGLTPAACSKDSAKALEKYFPPKSAAANPIDMGTALPGPGMAFACGAVNALMRDTSVDVVLAPLTTFQDIEILCDNLSAGAREAQASGYDKPLIVVFLSGQAGDPGREALRRHDVLYTDSLDEAIKALSGWRRYNALTPQHSTGRPTGMPSQRVSLAGGGAFGERETKEMLARYGVATNRGKIASDAEEARQAASRLTAPYVVKIVSPDIVHKSDVGGVVVALDSPNEVYEAVLALGQKMTDVRPNARIDGYSVQEMHRVELEIFVGARRDPQFGPLIVVGAGGILVEFIKDVAVSLCPISKEDAVSLLRNLSISKLLDGFRGSRPRDVDALADVIARISWLVVDLGERFVELDVNPILVGEVGKGCVAVDARLLTE